MSVPVAKNSRRTRKASTARHLAGPTGNRVPAGRTTRSDGHIGETAAWRRGAGVATRLGAEARHRGRASRRRASERAGGELVRRVGVREYGVRARACEREQRAERTALRVEALVVAHEVAAGVRRLVQVERPTEV